MINLSSMQDEVGEFILRSCKSINETNTIRAIGLQCSPTEGIVIFKYDTEERNEDILEEWSSEGGYLFYDWDTEYYKDGVKEIVDISGVSQVFNENYEMDDYYQPFFQFFSTIIENKLIRISEILSCDKFVLYFTGTDFTKEWKV